MNTYFLQFGYTDSAYSDYKKAGGKTTLPAERVFLDKDVHLENQVLDTIVAPSWKEARSQVSDVAAI